MSSPPRFLATDSIDELTETHRQLKTRLQELGKHRHLSPEERFEVQIIKKRKLALKDRISELQS